MSQVRKVAIVGGGVGGMTLATALRKEGIAAHVIEIAHSADQIGTGINLQNNALRVLDGIGVLDECVAQGFGWNTVTNCDPHGNVSKVLPLPWPSSPERPGALGIMRTVLAQILARSATNAGAQISYGTTVDSIESHDEGVSLRLSDGREEHADVVVAADGVYSPLRRLAFGDDHKPRYAGQGVWRYTVPRPPTIDGFRIYRSADGNTLGCLPLSDDLCYLFYLETSAEKPRFEPKDLPDALAQRLSAFDALELREAVEGIRSGRHISFRPFDVLLMPQPWHRGRVVLLGDAAHSLTPQLTSGGGMAVEDAAVLAAELSRGTDFEAALLAYGRRREKRVGTIYNNSYRICELEKCPSPDGAEGTRLMIESMKLLSTPY